MNTNADLYDAALCAGGNESHTITTHSFTNQKSHAHVGKREQKPNP